MQDSFDHFYLAYKTLCVFGVYSDDADPRRDFEIEARFLLDDGNPGVAHGMQWGKAELNQYEFFITANGEFTIDKFSGEFYDYVPFKESNAIRKNDFHTG